MGTAKEKIEAKGGDWVRAARAKILKRELRRPFWENRERLVS